MHKTSDEIQRFKIYLPGKGGHTRNATAHDTGEVAFYS